ncbi:MAG: RNA polymerase sigma factor, partial [Mycobacteriales bacterium]
MTAGCDDVRRTEADLLANLPAARAAADSDTDAIARAVDEAILGTPVDPGSDRRLRALADFGGLYIRQRGALIVHARRFLSDPHDIDDVVQETFLKLFLAMPEVETEAQALSFARRVLTNLCIDRYRAAQRRPATVDLDLGSADHLLAEDEPTDPVVQAEDAAIIREALARLSPLHRDALIKREIEEKPLPVIAAELGIPEESVKHLLFRARRMLRRLLVGTSVDPATPMTTPEVLHAANQRLARAALRSTNVFVALMVAVVAVAGGL